MRVSGGPGLALAGLVLLAACAGSTSADANDGSTSEDEIRFRAGAVDRELPDVDALGYEITVKIEDTEPAGHETLRASVKGTYAATKDLRELALDFEGNAIDEVRVSGRPARHRRDGARLVIELPERIADGSTFQARIDYHGPLVQADGMDPNDFAGFGGFMTKRANAEGKRIFTTLSWPSKARRWLPLRDHPRDAAEVVFDATFPKSFDVIANGEKKSVVINDDGTRTWHYEALQPMPPYDFHLSAYEKWKVEESRAAGVPIATYAYPRSATKTSKVYADVGKVLAFYQSIVGPYRYGSLAYIEEPIYAGGMEHASVVSMDETLFDGDLPQARRTAFHELAHHWSGNAVHFRTWNDFWLSEGFTEYLTARAVGHVDGPEAERMIWREYLTSVIAADKATPHPLAPPGGEIDVLTIFDDIPYLKGALTVRQLGRIIGEGAQGKMAAFLRGWFERHGLGAAVTTDQLERELTGETGANVRDFFATMVRQAGHPEVLVTFDGGTIEVKQLQSGGAFRFPLELDVGFTDGGRERVTVDLTGKTTTKRVARAIRDLVVDPDEYLVGVVSCGQSGGDRCKDGYRCLPQREGFSACVPNAVE